MGIRTSKEDLLGLVSQNLLSHSYLSMEEIEKLIPKNQLELTEILEELNELYSRIGIILEIIEFDEKQFVVVSLENYSEVPQFDSSVYSILTILAHLVSVKGNLLSINDISYIVSEYKEEFDILEQNKLILIDYSDKNKEFIRLSPIGANLISSVVPKFQELLMTIN